MKLFDIVDVDTFFSITWSKLDRFDLGHRQSDK